MNRNWTVLHKAELVDAHGNKCTVCAESDQTKIVWHHIVPKCMGGVDSIQNIIPLCVDCHIKAHEEVAKRKANKAGGRPGIAFSFDDYLNLVFGMVTNDDLAIKYGTSKASRFTDIAKRLGYDERIKAEYHIAGFHAVEGGSVVKYTDGAIIEFLRFKHKNGRIGMHSIYKSLGGRNI